MHEQIHHHLPAGTGAVTDEKLVNRKAGKPRRNGKPTGGYVEAEPVVFHFWPEGLDVGEVLRAANWTASEIASNRVWAEVYVGVICDQWQWRGARGDEYAPVWSEYLLTWIPDMMVGGEWLLKRLREAFLPVIEHKGYKRPNRAENIKGQCREYRLTEAYRSRKFTRRTVLSTQLSAKRHQRHAAWDRIQQQLQREWRPVHHTLREYCNRFHLPEGPEVLARLDNFVVRRLTGREERGFTLDYQNRFHNDVVRLDTGLRKYLRIRNEPNSPVYSVDVKSSQMLLLALMLTGRHTPRWEEVGGREAPQASKTADPAREIHWLFRSCSATGKIDTILIDLILSDAVDVYQLVADELNRGLPSPRYDRSDAKERVLCVVMGQAGAMHPQEAGKAIRSLWPGFFTALERLSANLADGGVPRVCQRIEAGIMERAAAAIIAERPDIVFAPGHDCFYLAQPDGSTERIDFVVSKIEQAWINEVGVAPRVKVEPLAAKEKRVKPEGAKGGRRKKGKKRLPTWNWVRAHKRDTPA